MWAVPVISLLAAAVMGFSGGAAECGPIGVAREPPLAQPPRLLATNGEEALVVTSPLDLVNGDVSNPAALRANPGPDGVSLREALLAAPGASGSLQVRFAADLSRLPLLLREPLPSIHRAHLELTGDVNNDGAADITLRGVGPSPPAYAIRLASSSTAVRALNLEGFGIGLLLAAAEARGNFGNVTIAHLKMRDVNNGILLVPFQQDNAHLPPYKVADAQETWEDSRIHGNVIDARESGIEIRGHYAANVTFDRMRIVDNTIIAGVIGIGAKAGFWHGSSNNAFLDLEISRNNIRGPLREEGILLSAADVGASRNSFDRVRIHENRVLVEASAPTPDNVLGLFGIFVTAGDAGTDWHDPTYRPITYASWNRVRDVSIRGNLVDGAGVVGILVSAGNLGAEGNEIVGLQINENVVRNIGVESYAAKTGITLEGAGAKSAVDARPSSLNRIRNVEIRSNIVHTLVDDPFLHPASGGITLAAATAGAMRNEISDVRVLQNDVKGAGATGIQLVGGIGDSVENTIARTVLSCNIVRNAPAPSLAPQKGISVIGGMFEGARGNVVGGVEINRNQVSGLPDDASRIEDHLGAQGNRIDAGPAEPVNDKPRPVFGPNASDLPKTKEAAPSTGDSGHAVANTVEKTPFSGWVTVLSALMLAGLAAKRRWPR